MQRGMKGYDSTQYPSSSIKLNSLGSNYSYSTVFFRCLFIHVLWMKTPFLFVHLFFQSIIAKGLFHLSYNALPLGTGPVSEPAFRDMFELLFPVSGTIFSLVQFFGTFDIHFSWQLYPQSAQCIPVERWEYIIYNLSRNEFYLHFI